MRLWLIIAVVLVVIQCQKGKLMVLLSVSLNQPYIYELITQLFFQAQFQIKQKISIKRKAKDYSFPI